MKDTDAYLLYTFPVLIAYFSADRTVNSSVGFFSSLTMTLGLTFCLLVATLYSNVKFYDRRQVARSNQPLSSSAMQDHYFDDVISAIDGIPISEPSNSSSWFGVRDCLKKGPYIGKRPKRSDNPDDFDANLENENDDDTMSDESDDVVHSSASENDDDVAYEQWTEDRGRPLSLSGDFCRNGTDIRSQSAIPMAWSREPRAIRGRKDGSYADAK